MIIIMICSYDFAPQFVMKYTVYSTVYNTSSIAVV